MKLNSLFFLVCFMFVSCSNTGKKHETPQLKNDSSKNPASVNQVLEKAGIPPLFSFTPTNYELRQWGAFSKDSFPSYLLRYSINNGKLIGNVYFFKRKEGEIYFEMRELKDIPPRFIDSIVSQYNLLHIENLDLNLTDSVIKRGHISHPPGFVLMEAKDSNGRTASYFIRKPIVFVLSDPNYARLTHIHTFIEDSLVKPNKAVLDWLMDELKKRADSAQ